MPTAKVATKPAKEAPFFIVGGITMYCPKCKNALQSVSVEAVRALVKHPHYGDANGPCPNNGKVFTVSPITIAATEV